VDLDIRPGEVHALCGQNGSGKSTLIKVLSGFHKADPGAVIELPGDQELNFIHQDLGLVDALTVSENLALSERRRGRRSLAPVRKGPERARARALFRQLGADIDVRAEVGQLRAAERTMVALARAIQGWEGHGHGVLVLDEPTVALPPSEVRRLFTVVRQIRDQGAGVLFVSHRTEEVLELADQISVLRDGKLVATGARADWSAENLVKEIVGKELGDPPARAGDEGTVRLAVRGLRAAGVRDVSLDLRAGEILGIGGLVGSGMEDLPAALFGAVAIEAGTITVDDRPLPTRGHSPRAAMRRGFAFVPSDRGIQGIVLEHTIRENITLPALAPVRGRYGLSRSRERRDAAQWARNVELQGADLERPLMNLSGGNQQKVVIARWLRTSPRILLLHEPTQGVDVGAKAAIYALLARAAADGAAVLMVSTDSGDFEQIAHRVLLLEGGRVAEELTGADITQHQVNLRLLAVSPSSGAA
jgi:ribose transport system ATP-binding protein